MEKILSSFEWDSNKDEINRESMQSALKTQSNSSTRHF